MHLTLRSNAYFEYKDNNEKKDLIHLAKYLSSFYFNTSHNNCGAWCYNRRK